MTEQNTFKRYDCPEQYAEAFQQMIDARERWREHPASLPSSSTTSRLAGPSLTVMRILGKSALTTDSIQDLFKPLKETTKPDDGQLYFDVTDCISSRNVILTCRFPLSSCVSSPSARQRHSQWESAQQVPRCHQNQRTACISQHRSCRPSR